MRGHAECVGCRVNQDGTDCVRRPAYYSIEESFTSEIIQTIAHIGSNYSMDIVMNGECACGCGQPALIATRNRSGRGWIKGRPLRYAWGHQRRRTALSAKPGFKFCAKCREEKPLAEFQSVSYGSTKTHSYCVSCATAAKSLWATNNREKNSATQLKSRLKLKYRLDQHVYDCLVVNQNGLCAICHQKSLDRRLAVDHDHVSGRVRGLLCAGCNLLLGLVRDKVEVLEEAIYYLKRSQE